MEFLLGYNGVWGNKEWRTKTMTKFSWDEKERECCWILHCAVPRYAWCHNSFPHKGLRKSLETEHAARKCILIFSSFIIFGEWLWVHISLLSVWKTIHSICFTLFYCMRSLWVQYNRWNYKIIEIRDSYGSDS